MYGQQPDPPSFCSDCGSPMLVFTEMTGMYDTRTGAQLALDRARCSRRLRFWQSHPTWTKWSTGWSIDPEWDL